MYTINNYVHMYLYKGATAYPAIPTSTSIFIRIYIKRKRYAHRFAIDLITTGVEGSLFLVAAYSHPRPHPRVDLMVGSLLLLVVVIVVVTGSLP
jgi:hypothetical protein